jgi:hypothetical protein
LDFAEDDFGGPEQAAVIDDWRTWRLHRNARQGEFICHRHRNHEKPWLYLQQRDALIVACHWPGTALAGTHEIAHGVSPEHRRQVEYEVRAAERVGWSAATEVRIPGARPDAVIYGPEIHMGVEAQRSTLGAPKAKARTTIARRAGIEPVWFAATRERPSWLWQVPGVRLNPDVSWRTLPPPRTVTVAGARIVVARRCRNISDNTCPRRRYGCNEWHALAEPRRETFADDLAEQVPAGLLVPMLYRTLSGRTRYIFIVSKNDKARYEAVVGHSADVPLARRESKSRGGPDRIECGGDAGARVGVAPGTRSTSSVTAQALQACNAHAQWPDHPFRCRKPGCPGNEPPAAEVD